MFRPSSRRKSVQNEVVLNLVPILDTFVTLIAFLLFSTAFLAIAFIDTPAPLLAPPEEQIEQMKDKPLQLTAHLQENQILLSDWSGSRVAETIPNIQDPKTGESIFDLEKLHQVLLTIKQKFPVETKLILKPVDAIQYDKIVEIMDAARTIEKTDPPMYKKGENGVDMPETKLFPEVIFGNLMS